MCYVVCSLCSLVSSMYYAVCPLCSVVCSVFCELCSFKRSVCIVYYHFQTKCCPFKSNEAHFVVYLLIARNIQVLAFTLKTHCTVYSVHSVDSFYTVHTLCSEHPDASFYTANAVYNDTLYHRLASFTEVTFVNAQHAQMSTSVIEVCLWYIGFVLMFNWSLQY